MTPPLMLALLTQARAINVSAEHIHVEFHETGRAACFWLDVHQDNLATERSPEERMETLIVSALQPVIQALEAIFWYAEPAANVTAYLTYSSAATAR